MAALGGDRCAGQPRGAGAHYRHPLRRGGLCIVQFGLGAGARVDQATGGFLLEHVVQAGLIAGDTRIDAIGAAGAGLVRPVRVGQQRARHRDQVGAAAGEDAFGHVGHVDAVGRDQRQLHFRTQLGGHARERRARHRGGDGRHPRLVPADAGVEDGRTGRFDGFGLGDDVLPARTFRHQFQHRQPINNDEVRAAGFAYPTHDLGREAHALLQIAAPAVLAAVGTGAEELVDQIAFRAHDLDAVVAAVAGEAGGVGVGRDRAFHAETGQRARRERIDRRFDFRRRHRQRVIGIAAGVQQLQADLRAVRVYGIGDQAMFARFPWPAELAGERRQPAHHVRREATGDDQPDATGRAFTEIGGELGKIAGAILQPGVHRPHQHPVAQGGEAEIERREQMRVGGRIGLGGHRSIRRRMQACTMPVKQGRFKRGSRNRRDMRSRIPRRAAAFIEGRSGQRGPIRATAGPGTARCWYSTASSPPIPM